MLQPARARRSTTRNTTSPKSERFALRITKSQRELLNEASRATQTSVSDFVLDAATNAAEQVLADRTEFALSSNDWEQLVRALDAPVRPLPRLRRLLESPTVLDEA